MSPQDNLPPATTPPSVKSSPKWLTLAIGSGAFAALNGVFAKLTTTSQTHTLASSIAHLLGLSPSNGIVEIGIRAIFFGLNLISNAIMWVLFTRALTAATSTTRVAILNTSANFMVTALLGMLVFSEGLPLGWWVGAGLLVAGSVVIGAREGKVQDGEGVDKGVGLDESFGAGDGAGVAAAGIGAGGVGQSVLAGGRFRDEPGEGNYQDDDDSDPDIGPGEAHGR